MISSVYTLLSDNSNLSVCFFENTKTLFTEQIKNPIIEYDRNFKIEFEKFVDMLKYIKNIKDYQFWPSISPCISGYLIKKSYLNTNNDRIQSFNEFKSNHFSFKNSDEEDYIELRNLGIGSLSEVQLIYHIKRGELFVIKRKNEREKSNYEQIQHPFIPKFYGTAKNDDFIVIEFINGQTLDKCQFDKYDIDDIIIIIHNLMLIVEFIHDEHLLIRDLKPSNLMITGENDIVMIDFDRAIK